MKTLSHYHYNLEALTSYPIGKIFNKDNPSAKEKKHEQRCVVCVDKFYGHKLFNPCRELLRDIEASVLLFQKDIVPPQLFESCGRLQARLEHLQKAVNNSCKSEKVLIEYYYCDTDHNVFSMLIEDLLDILSKLDKDEAYVPCDLKPWKIMYFDAYKDEKKIIREENK